MNTDKSVRSEAHEKIRAALDSAGLVDSFYGGVMMDGKDISSYTVGVLDKTEYSNVERVQRIIGIIEALKCQLCGEMNNNTYKETQEDDGEI